MRKGMLSSVLIAITFLVSAQSPSVKQKEIQAVQDRFALNLTKGEVLEDVTNYIIRDQELRRTGSVKNIILQIPVIDKKFKVTATQYNLLRNTLERIGVQVILNSKDEMIGYSEIID